jgi:hypothetical protein
MEYVGFTTKKAAKIDSNSDSHEQMHFIRRNESKESSKLCEEHNLPTLVVG